MQSGTCQCRPGTGDEKLSVPGFFCCKEMRTGKAVTGSRHALERAKPAFSPYASGKGPVNPGFCKREGRRVRKNAKMQSIVFFGVLDSDSERREGAKKNKIVIFA